MAQLPQFQDDNQNFQLMQNAWATQLNPLLRDFDQLGKLEQSINSTGVTLSTGVITNIASITLSRGEWDIWASFTIGGAAPGGTVFTGSISLGINKIESDTTGTLTAQTPLQPTAASDVTVPIIPNPVIVKQPTTYYLNAQATFVGALACYGTIRARLVKVI